VRHLSRLSIAVLTATLVFSLADRSGISAQQPAPPQGGQPPQGGPPQGGPPQGAPGGPGGRGVFQLRNVQVLKDVPQDQWQLVMQYIAASLGGQCNYCHVMGDNASDDKQTKQTARKMMQMVADLNKQFFAGKPTVSCASCHNGHPKPSKVTPLAINMTQDEAAAAAAARGRRGGGPGGPGGGPGGAPAAAGPGGAPGAASGAAGATGRGPAGPPPPPAVTETVDEVLSKYVQALGGQQALQNAKTRVMTGTVTNRDLTTANVTQTEKNTGESRIEIATQPNPIIRATNGTAAWQIGGGGGGFGGGNNARDIAGFQVQQGFRLADFSLPLNLKQRYQNLTVKPAYETIDGKQAVVLTGSPYPNVTEDLAFDKESGLLLRRTVNSGTTGGFGILALGEQIDYSDYRDVSGVKEPFSVKHSTWNAVTTEKFTDVKINAPVTDSIFAKPAAQQ